MNPRGVILHPLTPHLITGSFAPIASLADYDEWLAGVGLDPKTVRLYTKAVTRVLSFCAERGTDLEGVTRTQLAEYVFATPPSSSARRQLRSALGHWWRMTNRPEPPLGAVKVPPKPRGRCRALSEEDARLVVKAAREEGHPRGTAVLLAVQLGLRCFEVASATWGGFEEDHWWYTLTGKRLVTASIPVASSLRNWIRFVAGDRTTGFMFPGYKQRPHVTEQTVWNWVGRVGRDAGLVHLAPHVLRHTAIATVNDVTGDLRAAQEFARHARPETTALYTRVSIERMQAAADALEF